MLVHPQFDPIAIKLFGPLAIRWYGLMYLVGFALLWLAGRYAIKTRPHTGMTAQHFDDLLFYGILGVILGGRLDMCFFTNSATTSPNRGKYFTCGKAACRFTADFSA